MFLHEKKIKNLPRLADGGKIGGRNTLNETGGLRKVVIKS